MVLLSPNLQGQLGGFFKSPPLDLELSIQQTGAILQSYVALITPPSSTVVAATEALKGQLRGIYKSTIDSGSALELAFKSWAATIGAGMAPAFAATPPAGTIGFARLFSNNPATHEEAAAQLWLLTGIAVNNTSGATVNWA